MRHRHLTPKAPLDNVRFRKEVLATARCSEWRQRALVRMCREDPIFWIDTFVWQYNPNTFGTNSLELGPFISWDFQEQAVEKILWCIANRRDLVLEKSREMGASWLCLLVMLHQALFFPLKTFLCISHNEKAVDDHSSDSLFWKLDFVLDHLPHWMKPEVMRRDLFIGFANRSAITGQATTKRSGVGGRATAMFLDEFSQIRDAYDIVDRTSNTTSCRIFNGTHLGTGTAFFELTNPESLIGRYVTKHVMHWSMHPDKNKGLYRYDDAKARVEVVDKSYQFTPDYQFVTDGTPTGGPFPGLRSPWYDDACRRKTRSTAIAMDLDIDPQRSVEQLFDPVVVNSLVAQYARDPSWEGDILLDDTGEARLAARRGGPLKLWINPDKDGKPPKDDYFIGVDNAAGTGATPSVGSICNSRGEKVGEYTNPQIEPTPMAQLFVPLCRLFSNSEGLGATLGWEIPGPGATFGKRVIEYGYRRVYFKRDDSRIGKHVSEKPGWVNEPNSKLALITSYRDALRERHFINHSAHALKDCLNFRFRADGYVEHSGEASTKDHSGARVNHGDHVIADALAFRILADSGRLAAGPGQGPKKEIEVGSRQWRGILAEEQSRETNWSNY